MAIKASEDAARNCSTGLSAHACEILGAMRGTHRKPGARLLVGELENRLGATDPALAAAISELTQRGYVVVPGAGTIELTARGFDALQDPAVCAGQPQPGGEQNGRA